MNLRLTCKEASRLLSEGQDRELRSAERTRARLHLVVCAACRNVNEQLHFLRRAMQRLKPDETGFDDQRR